MIASISKWGNSLAVRIPVEALRELEIKEGARLDLAVENGALVLRPVSKRVRYDLDALLEGMTAENLHGETSTGDAVGNEL